MPCEGLLLHIIGGGLSTFPTFPIKDRKVVGFILLRSGSRSNLPDVGVQPVNPIIGLTRSKLLNQAGMFGLREEDEIHIPILFIFFFFITSYFYTSYFITSYFMKRTVFSVFICFHLF